MSFLRAIIANEFYNRVGCFRRVTYVKPEDVAKIPEIFKINFNNLNYFIYASTKTLKSFICKLEGHLAKNCRITDNVNSNVSNIQIVDCQDKTNALINSTNNNN